MTRGVRFKMPVRYSDPDGWEGFCGDCRSWWPLDLEYWHESIRGGVCRACRNITDAERCRIRYAKAEAHRERQKAWARQYRASMTPAEKAAYLEKHRGYQRERRKRAA